MQKVQGLVQLLTQKNLVVKVTHSVPGPFWWNNNMRHIYLCECILRTFIARNYSCHPWLWPAYVKSWFAFIRTLEIKGLCLQLKRFGTKYAAQKSNFFTSAVANGCPLPLWKVSFGSDKIFMSYYLFSFSSHQHVQHMTSQILLILIDFDRF